MDVADRAQRAEELHREVSLAARRAAPSVQVGMHCLGCGEEIPEARRRAVPGCCLCVDCQADAERSMGR